MNKGNELSKCEKEVMETIYSMGTEPTLNEIREVVNPNHGHQWKPQTVSTFLARLVKKGWLSMYRKGRYCYYKTLRTRKEFETCLFEELLAAGFGGNIEKLEKAAKEFVNERMVQNG